MCGPLKPVETLYVTSGIYPRSPRSSSVGHLPPPMWRRTLAGAIIATLPHSPMGAKLHDGDTFPQREPVEASVISDRLSCQATGRICRHVVYLLRTPLPVSHRDFVDLQKTTLMSSTKDDESFEISSGSELFTRLPRLLHQLCERHVVNEKCEKRPKQQVTAKAKVQDTNVQTNKPIN